MKPSREQIIAWARKAGMPIGTKLVNGVTPEPCVTVELQRFAELVASAGESEPVAWLWHNVRTGTKGIFPKDPAAIAPKWHSEYVVTPLYTHPTPATAGDVRKPMTEEQIDSLKGGPSQTYRDFARAVEAFHDIVSVDGNNTDKEQQS